MVDRIGAILLEAKLPAADVIRSSTAPLKLLQRLGAGLRTNTLKAKIRTYEKMKRWLDSVYGTFFVVSPVQAMDYLTDRADEPCGSSIPGDVVAIISFFENLGNRPTSERVANSGRLRNLVSELQVALAVDKPRVKRKAVPYLAIFLASWETTVMDLAQPCYVRTLAWVKCLQVWAALRTSDMANISPQSLELGTARLSGKNHRQQDNRRGQEGPFLGVLRQPQLLAGTGGLDRSWPRDPTERCQATRVPATASQRRLFKLQRTGGNLQRDVRGDSETPRG